MRLILSPRAARRLREIQAYLAQEANPHIALQIVVRIRQSAEMLTDFPRLGARWAEGPTRSLLVSGLPYRIHYRLSDDAVEIITIVHTSQRPPEFC